MNAIIVNATSYGHTRNELMAYLKENGIDSRLLFLGMHGQPSLKKYGCNCSDSYPYTSSITETGIYLPSSSKLKSKEIDYICSIIKKSHI